MIITQIQNKVPKTFPTGGIHPDEVKLTAASEVRILPVPARVIIPLSQHIGADPVPVVNRGDHVRTGQLIAAANSYVSANIHSPVSGKIAKIDTVTDTSGYPKAAIFIETDGDEWAEGIDRSSDLVKEIRLRDDEILARCREAGIVGMGGAAFPSHVKLSIPEGKKCRTLIINGVECEPYLTSDHRLMLEKGEELMIGITILGKVLKPEKIIIGIEENKPDAIEALARIAVDYPGITVQGLRVKYPQGAEKQLIKAVLDSEVPPGKLPIDIGVVVQNVATAFAVYEAVQKNKPLIERIVTVSGKSLSAPGNFLVRIGTTFGELIEAAGGLPGDAGKVLNGGPMMGKAVSSLEVPVIKGTSGIVVLTGDESERDETGPCIRCGRCSAACSFNQQPYLMMTLAMKGMWEKAEAEGITECMECGSCSFVCPASRPILDYIRLGKMTVNKLIRERNAKSIQ